MATTTVEEIARCLTTGGVAVLNFCVASEYGSLLVTPGMFREVAQALQDGTIELVLTDDPSYGAAGVSMAYHVITNSFVVVTNNSPSAGPVRQSFFVHEAVHAARDRTGVRAWTLLEEVTAYLAQCAYLLVGVGNEAIEQELRALEGRGATERLRAAMFRTCLRHGLHRPGGFPRIPEAESLALAQSLNDLPTIYAHSGRRLMLNDGWTCGPECRMGRLRGQARRLQ